eukprot:7385184-Prymnesium_polylepis.1
MGAVTAERDEARANLEARAASDAAVAERDAARDAEVLELRAAAAGGEGEVVSGLLAPPTRPPPPASAFG